MIPLSNTRRFFYKALKQPAYALSVFARRLINYFYYFSSGGKSFYPEAVTLFLTYRCNLRCKMCGQWGESGVTKKRPAHDTKENLSFLELKNLIDDLSFFRPNITLFGGEPLLYPHLLELIRYIKEKNMHCLLITNGSLLDGQAKDLSESGLDELNVSLDAKSRLHDEIRGMPGLFKKIEEGLKKINGLKQRKRSRRPLINLQCTITKYNYHSLAEMLDVAEEVKADSLTFHNLIFLGRGEIEKQKEYDRLFGLNSFDWEGFVSSPEIDPGLLYKNIKKILKRNYSFPVDFYPNLSLEGLRKYYQDYPSSLEYSQRCISPWMVAYIFPEGEVRPCLNFSNSYGNITKDKFSRLWNSPEAQRFRRLLKQNKLFPVCLRCTELYRY